MTSILGDFILNNFVPYALFFSLFSVSRKKEELQQLMSSMLVICEADVAFRLKVEL